MKNRVNNWSTCLVQFREFISTYKSPIPPDIFFEMSGVFSDPTFTIKFFIELCIAIWASEIPFMEF